MFTPRRQLKTYIEIFRQDMLRQGVFVAPEVPDKNWESPSFRYSVVAGLYRYLPGEIKRETCVWQMEIEDLGEQGFLNKRFCTSELDFRTEQPRGKDRNYRLILPGEIVRGARSLAAMTDGTSLLVTLENWADLNANFIRQTTENDTVRGIGKIYELDPERLNAPR